MASSSVDENDGWPARRLGLSRAGAGTHLSIVRVKQSRAEEREV